MFDRRARCSTTPDRTGVSPIRRGDAGFLTIHAAFSIRVPRTIPHTVHRRHSSTFCGGQRFFRPRRQTRGFLDPPDRACVSTTKLTFSAHPIPPPAGALRGPPRQPEQEQVQPAAPVARSSVNGPLAMGRTSKTGRPRSVTWIGSPDCSISLNTSSIRAFNFDFEICM